jgi:hypothetical protein
VSPHALALLIYHRLSFIIENVLMIKRVTNRLNRDL